VSDQEQGAGLNRRIPEAGVAALLLAAGGIVIMDSLRVGIEWADDGPKAGYFPFFIGILLSFSAGWTAVHPARLESRDQAVFAMERVARRRRDAGADHGIHRRRALPRSVFPGALLIGYFMKRHGDFGWVATILTSLGVPLTFFLIFERWFLVPLAKGPIEAWLGF
jgi:putative tricarboxylic transport membrane protein